MRQKLVKIRSSLGVVLPPEVVDALKLEKGDLMERHDAAYRKLAE